MASKTGLKKTHSPEEALVNPDQSSPPSTKPDLAIVKQISAYLMASFKIDSLISEVKTFPQTVDKIKAEEAHLSRKKDHITIFLNEQENHNTTRQEYYEKVRTEVELKVEERIKQLKERIACELHQATIEIEEIISVNKNPKATIIDLSTEIKLRSGKAIRLNNSHPSPLNRELWTFNQDFLNEEST